MPGPGKRGSYHCVEYEAAAYRFDSRHRRGACGYNLGMAFDPVVSLKIVNNQRLMQATHRGEYRDLGGALCITSDASEPKWNCIEGFTTTDARLSSLFDIGFSLLRAFDRPPAARTTPLDRPAKIADYLRRSGFVEREREVSMTFPGDPGAIAVNDAVTIKRAEPDDASAFVTLHQRANNYADWRKSFLLGATLANIIDPDHTFYIASLDGEPAGTLLTVRDGQTAGLYSIATLKSVRGHRVASTMIARAITDAQDGGVDCICLETEAGSDAARLYADVGFVPAHETVLWVGR